MEKFTVEADKNNVLRWPGISVLLHESQTCFMTIHHLGFHLPLSRLRILSTLTLNLTLDCKSWGEELSYLDVIPAQGFSIQHLIALVYHVQVVLWRSGLFWLHLLVVLCILCVFLSPALLLPLTVCAASGSCSSHLLINTGIPHPAIRMSPYLVVLLLRPNSCQSWTLCWMLFFFVPARFSLTLLCLCFFSGSPAHLHSDTLPVSRLPHLRRFLDSPEQTLWSSLLDSPHWTPSPFPLDSRFPLHPRSST